MLIQLNDNLIHPDEWMDLYNKVRLKRIPHDNFGYGIKVSAEHLSKKIDLPLFPYFFFLVSNRRKREFPIHVDGIPGKQAASLNWGLVGCDESSPTEYYQCTKKPKWDNKDGSYFLKNVEDVVLTHTNVILNNRAYLFRSDLLHRGYSYSNKRLMVKWELEYDDWNTACSEFRDRNLI